MWATSCMLFLSARTMFRLRHPRQHLGSVPAPEPGLLSLSLRSACLETQDETFCASRVLTTGIWASGKSFSISERVKFALHVDTFNTFNHHQYGGDVGGLILAGSGGNAAISRTVGASDFGQITQASSPRILQLSGKLTF